MKVQLPENIEDITLGQYQKKHELDQREGLSQDAYNKRLISIFTNLSNRDVEKISLKDYDYIINQINTALTKDVEFKDRFYINDVEFGFIPNFDKITQAEYVDLGMHGVEIENLHKTMAVLFRPIKNKDFLGSYLIEDYTGTKEYADVMKYMPINIVNGALVFFSSLSKELKNYIQKSTAEVQARVNGLRDTSKNGDGIQS